MTARPYISRPAEVSYRGPFCGKCGQRVGYQGLYALPGDARWRVVRDVTGHTTRFSTGTDAETAARAALAESAEARP